ncbi:MAG: rhamnulokinase [Planctomycetaceae bacterium]|nr:rhamnulokinase [Planctomycetaceae bacterium]
MKTYLAVDMGASGGRLIAGRFDGARLETEELYRFDNGAIDLAGTLYWDVPGLWKNILTGLQIASSRFGNSVTSIGVDSWGVDFALLDKNDTIIGNPVCYRDSRTNGMVEKALNIMPRYDIFQHSGLQFMQINTLFQLIAMRQNQSHILDIAKSFLMISDLFHWLLCGVKSNEFTNATTTQFYNPVKQNWSDTILSKFDIPREIFLDIAQPCTELGNLRNEISSHVGGLSGLKVVLPGTHDTASSVMSVPAFGKIGSTNWCYICLGTWALIGIESPSPVMNKTVYELNFTNEGGVGGTTRILKNVTGLWLLQECRRIWNERGRQIGWEEMNNLTKEAVPLKSFINPDADEFLCPPNMPEAIVEFCRKTQQPVPETEGEILRCAVDSIALRLRQVLSMCETISGNKIGNKIKVIHIVGGGAKHNLLCQSIADATGQQVLAGPIESTAIGNIMSQSVTAGDIANIEEAREIIRNSFDIKTFTPNTKNNDKWDAADNFIRNIKK